MSVTSFLTQCSNDACTDFAACPAGWSSGTQDPEPLRSCKQCDAGQTSSAASTVCRDCTKGTFGVIDSSGAGVCAFCPSGYFQPEETSATSCKRCPIGWTQESEGESSCRDQGGLKPSDCKDDEYFNVTDCVDCPPGGSCVGDITASGIRTLFGWYRCPNDAFNLTYEPCLVGEACLGAPNRALKGDFEKKDLETGVVHDPALDDNASACAAGFSNASRNLRCSTCAPNFAPVESGRCEECTGGSEGSTAIIVLAVFFAIILFTIMIAFRMRSKGSRKAEHSTMKRTLLTHLQMLSIVMSLTVPWPSAVRSIFTFVSSITSISAQAASIQCTTTGEWLTRAKIFYLTLICSVLLPFVMMLVTFLYWFVCAPRCKVLSCGKKLRRSPLCPARNPFRVRQQSPPPPPQPPQQQQQQVVAVSEQQPTEPAANRGTKTRKYAQHSTRDGWIITNVLLVYILNPSIVKSCFQMFQSNMLCQTKYWSLDDTIIFDDDTHQIMILVVAVPSLILYGVVCPLLVMLYIGMHSDRQTNRKLMFRFGLLYSGFAPKYWFYELILFLRKILIILIVTFASSSEHQLHLALYVLIVLLCFLERLRPYSAENASAEETIVQTRLHQMEFLSLIVLIGMVWSAVFFVLGCKDDEGTCSVLGVAIVGFNMIFALGCGYTFLKAYKKRKMKSFTKKLNKLSSALSFRLNRHSASGRRTEEERGGDQRQSGEDGNDEFHFETAEIGSGPDEIGCTVKINPLANGITRNEFATRRKSTVPTRQVVNSGLGSSDGSSIVSNSNGVTTGAAAEIEIEMTSVEKTKTTYVATRDIDSGLDTCV